MCGQVIICVMITTPNTNQHANQLPFQLKTGEKKLITLRPAPVSGGIQGPLLPELQFFTSPAAHLQRTF